MKLHKAQLLRIFDAIDHLFSDTTVPAQITEESLTEIRDSVDAKLECLKADRKRPTLHRARIDLPEGR